MCLTADCARGDMFLRVRHGAMGQWEGGGRRKTEPTSSSTDGHRFTVSPHALRHETSRASSPLDMQPGDGFLDWVVDGLSTARVSDGCTKTAASAVGISRYSLPL